MDLNKGLIPCRPGQEQLLPQIFSIFSKIEHESVHQDSGLSYTKYKKWLSTYDRVDYTTKCS